MTARLASLCALLLGLTFHQFASAAVITVNTGSDPIDIDWQTATVDDLPGPDGLVSFSEAMIASNNTPGHDTVEFAIPQSAWTMQWLYPGFPVIYSSYTYFWRANDEVTIDGFSQSAFTGDTNPDGAELRFYGSEIFLNAGNSTFQGIHGGAVSLSGSNNLVTGCSGGINVSLFGGSGTVIRDNECGTIKIDRSSANLVVRNVASRVRIWGTPSMPGDDNVVGGPDPADRNFIVGYGTTNSEGLPAGTAIELASVNRTLIENNWIGLSLDGLGQGNQYCTQGIWFQGTNSDNVVRNNRIAGILGHGIGPHHAGHLFGTAIMISGSGSGFTIAGNTVGLDANDEPLLGSVTGIDVGTWAYGDASNIEISDNVIAGHYFQGIIVGASVPQARLSRNEIFENGMLGIDLIPTGFGTGVSPNDALDADTGGNGLQNFPQIATALADASMISVAGTLHSSADTDFTLEFFASPQCDESGNGEGRRYLGSTTVHTDGAGDASFDSMFATAVDAGWVVTATATAEPEGRTSEFSTCVAFVPAELGATPVPLALPGEAILGQPWPNPANPAISIDFTVPREGYQEVRVIDARGRVVHTLLQGTIEAGTHTLRWDGRDHAGRPAASGIYFVHAVGTSTPAQRVTLLR